MMSYLESLVEQDDGDAGAQLALIQAYMQNGETDEVLALVDKLIDEDPGNLNLLYFRGLAQAQAGELDAATETFTDLVQSEPNAVLGMDSARGITSCRK